MGRRASILRRVVVFLLIGAAMSIGLAWAFAEGADPAGRGVTQHWQGYENGMRWNVQIYHRFGAISIESAHNVGGDWAPEQALSAPDCPGSGDHRTAWCPATADGQREWLDLTYPDSVRARGVVVYANYGPGSIDRVCVYNPAGELIEAWSGKDPMQTVAGVGVSNISFTVPFEVNRVRIALNSPALQGWQEIDAVGLVDESGIARWATSVAASSSYGQSPAPGVPFGNIEAEIPWWVRVVQPDLLRHVATNQHTLAAFGWPLPALYSGDGVIRPGLAVITLRPIWPGLLIDSLLLGTLAGLIFTSLAWPRRLIRETSRMRNGFCLKCGYDLRFDFVAGCPECGWRRSS